MANTIIFSFDSHPYKQLWMTLKDYISFVSNLDSLESRLELEFRGESPDTFCSSDIYSISKHKGGKNATHEILF